MDPSSLAELRKETRRLASDAATSGSGSKEKPRRPVPRTMVVYTERGPVAPQKALPVIQKVVEGISPELVRRLKSIEDRLDRIEGALGALAMAAEQVTQEAANGQEEDHPRVDP